MDVEFKVPEESVDYPKHSEFVVAAISKIMQKSIDDKNNFIFIRTNLKRGLPLENINKVAGPFIEAWAVEQFERIVADTGNEYQLINVEPGRVWPPMT
jgi:hypothetical protein